MKTREEVLKHLKTTGYTKNAMYRISGFLIGAGLKEESEEILYKTGCGEWGDFYEWWLSEDTIDAAIDYDETVSVLFDMLKELCENHNATADEERKNTLGKRCVALAYALDTFMNEKEG